MKETLYSCTALLLLRLGTHRTNALLSWMCGELSGSKTFHHSAADTRMLELTSKERTRNWHSSVLADRTMKTDFPVCWDSWTPLCELTTLIYTKSEPLRSITYLHDLPYSFAGLLFVLCNNHPFPSCKATGLHNQSRKVCAVKIRQFLII